MESRQQPKGNEGLETIPLSLSITLSDEIVIGESVSVSISSGSTISTLGTLLSEKGHIKQEFKENRKELKRIQIELDRGGAGSLDQLKQLIVHLTRVLHKARALVLAIRELAAAIAIVLKRTRALSSPKSTLLRECPWHFFHGTRPPDDCEIQVCLFSRNSGVTHSFRPAV